MTLKLKTAFSFQWLISLLLLLFSTGWSVAQVDQDGWKLIMENDFVKAKQVFLSRLASHPDDNEALVGVIFISETVQDYDSYKQYIKALIETDFEPHYLRLFSHMYPTQPDSMLKKNIKESLKTYYHFAWADSLFKERKFDESRQIYREVTGDYNWSVIGPFSNRSGSGFIEDFPVEQNDFSMRESYTNEKGMELRWHNKEQRPPNGKVAFYDILQYSPEAVYYANTFIEIPAPRLLQLRINRSTPMKIWLDDDLIFENDNSVNKLWDAEIVELKVGKGVHRLLVKTADYMAWDESKTLSLNYHDDYDYGDGFVDQKTDLWQDQDDRDYYLPEQDQSVFGIRLTDSNGRLYTDIGSYFSSAYQPQSYDQNDFGFELIPYFQAEINDKPADFKQYYLLCKAYQLYELYEEGEELFHDFFEKHKDSGYFRFLLARFYASNGKGQKAEELITVLDNEKMPFLALMNTELAKIDAEKNESQYLTNLDKMLSFSPTNWRLISNYLDFFQKKGKTKEKRQFIKSFLEEHPDAEFQKRLKPYLKDDSYKPASSKPATDKERERKAKTALRNTRKRFLLQDYATAIAYFKHNEKKEEVLKLYDELIDLFPYRTKFYKDKARFLFENDDLDNALAELHKALKISIYDKDVYESIGDIYVEKNQPVHALINYRKVRQLIRHSSYSYGMDAIDKKIRRMEKEPSIKEWFEPMTFDKVLMDKAWKTRYPEDAAVVLLYTTEAALDEENTIDYTQKLMIYVQNDAGAKYWTEANFGFLGEISFVKILKKDGRSTSPERNYGYVVFKNLEAGDIIQIEGHSKANMNNELDGELFHIAALSHDFPVYKAKMEFIHPKEVTLNYTCYRLECTPQIKTKGAYQLLSWEFENIPKMEREEAILDDLDIYAWMMFSTQKDWSKIVEWYIDKTYRRLETNYEIEAILLNLLDDGLSEQEVVERIYNYVTEEITYSHVGFLNANYIPKKPSSTISDQIGDCKDVASLMISMLRYTGIEAYYILVRSSNYTSQKPLPAIAAFNHVILGYVLSDGIMRYVDLTTDYYPHYVIPEFDNNSWALLIKEGETDVFQLPNDMLDPTKSRLEIKADARIKDDRSLEIKAQIEGEGVLSGKLREALNRVTTRDERQKYISDYFGEGGFDHLIIEDFELQELSQLSTPFKANLRLKAFNHVEKVSSFYIVQIPLLKSITTEPVLFAQNRYNNLDLQTLFETAPTIQEIHLEIPAEFELMEMPENIEYDNQFGTYRLDFEKTENGVSIHRSLIMKTRKVNYQDYEAFKAFYLQLLDADRTKLAVVKR